MRILFANESPFLPQLVGGIEISTLDLSHALRERGHDPAVMSSLITHNALWLRNRIVGKLLRQGFPMNAIAACASTVVGTSPWVWRKWPPASGPTS